jgi:branched-chain amino acid transport system permease protein
VPNIADQISKAAPWAVYGVFLLVFVFLAPRGVAGFTQLLWVKAIKRVNRSKEQRETLQV